MYGDQFGEFVCGYRGLRELQHRRRQRQRGSQKSNTFNTQNHHSARTTHFFVHFFAITARLLREILSRDILWRT